MSQADAEQDNQLNGQSYFRDIQEEALFEEIVEESTEGVAVIDPDWRVVYLNRKGEMIIGATRNNIKGRGLWEVCPEDPESPFYRSLTSSKSERRSLEFEDYFGFIKRWLKVRVHFREDWLFLYFSDTSIQKELQEQNAYIAARESQTRDQMSEAGRLRDEFLATLSHELRTPLTAIYGWIKLLRAGVATEDELCQGLESIERNVRVQIELIEELLDVSRITTGKLKLDLDNVDMKTLVEASLGTFRPVMEAKQLKLSKELKERVLPVKGDAKRLQQVLWNLLSNAVKFTPQGGEISIKLDQQGKHTRLVVKDTGRGIPASYLKDIFVKFKQVEAHSTSARPGLGLGLSIARDIVELHNGVIEVESRGEELGSSFTVLLPSVTNPDVVPSPKTPDDKTSYSSTLTGLKVLVVDDDDDTRIILTTVLKKFGMEVYTASSSSEGLERFLQKRPDILISDLKMPHEDGFAFIKKVRSLESDKGGDLPAIALTAYAMPQERSRALSAGFQEHISKPFSAAQLVKVISTLCSAH
jgi:PAS domain S-box-containing protein